jgi:hypothetical protein
MKLGRFMFQRPWLYRTAGRLARAFWGIINRRWPGNPANAWLVGRALPPAPKSDFRSWWSREGAASIEPPHTPAASPPAEAPAEKERRHG